MKITLAIDTATARTQIAILAGDELRWLEIEDGATTHGDVLAKFGERAAKEQIDQVIVGMGPGPFTGLRTGIVFAKSFAFARGLPVHGICSLDAIAYSIVEPEFIVTTDARRKELYWAHYQIDANGEALPLTPEQVGPPSGLQLPAAAHWGIAGSGWAVHGGAIADGSQAGRPATLVFPEAQDVAALGALQAAAGRLVAADRLAPVYLRPAV